VKGLSACPLGSRPRGALFDSKPEAQTAPDGSFAARRTRFSGRRASEEVARSASQSSSEPRARRMSRHLVGGIGSADA
jgi:hypothetical protein